MKRTRIETHPELSVVLSTFGNYHLLRRVLDGYARQDAPHGSFELIVVVDQSDPNPGIVDEVIRDHPYPVRRLVGRSPGLSANRNTGWRAANASTVLLTDNDTIPVPKLISEHLAWHRRFPQEGVAVLGHVRWAREIQVTPFMRWLERGIQFDYPSIKGTEASWAHLYGANCSIKRRFIKRVGDWDEVRLPYGYEDLDWNYRASKAGLRVVYNRRAIVDHLRPDMTLEFWKKRVRRIALSEYQFVQMHPELEPWFYNLFKAAAQRPPARGRGIPVTRFVPRWVPWLGTRAWGSADLSWKQALAPHFLEAWEEAALGAVPQPDSSETDLRTSEMPSGSSPGAPK